MKNNVTAAKLQKKMQERSYKVMRKRGEYYARKNERYEGVNGRGYTNAYTLRSAFAIVMQNEKEYLEMMNKGEYPRDIKQLPTYQIRTYSGSVVYTTDWYDITPCNYFGQWNEPQA